ncbi:hypothetical protein JX266_012152 [Neoarthrinium moseri]|nr:hypothetical protein JX266_012152 [Neoarthrinium moseri]
MSAESKKATKAAPKVSKLTERDQELMVIAWQCLENPTINMQKFTGAANYGSQDSARVSWRACKKRLLEAFPDINIADGAISTPGPKVPKKAAGSGSGKRKKAASDDAAGNADAGADELGDGSSAPKKRRATPKKAKAKSQETVSEASEEEHVKEEADKGEETATAAADDGEA